MSEESSLFRVKETSSNKSKVEGRSGKIAIKRLDETEEGIDEKTAIVRYMKLETFLLLLAGQVFFRVMNCCRLLIHWKENSFLVYRIAFGKITRRTFVADCNHSWARSPIAVRPAPVYWHELPL